MMIYLRKLVSDGGRHDIMRIKVSDRSRQSDISTRYCWQRDEMR